MVAIQEMKKARKKHKDKGRQLDDCDFHLVLTFASKERRDRLLTLAKLPAGQRFVDGERFIDLLPGV